MANTKCEEAHLIWLQTSSCSGCSVSVLNSESPTIKNILVDEVLPGKHVSIRFHPTIMAGSGGKALDSLGKTWEELRGGYLLVVEGAVPTAEQGVYGEMGAGEQGHTMLEWVEMLGKDAMVVVALGTCASFGGIPAAGGNPTGCKSVRHVFEEKKISTPLVNIPGCPPHPDWFVGTVAQLLAFGPPKPGELDEHLRPKMFYGKLVHENCPRRAYFDEGKFAKRFGDEGCLYELGCKGPVTYADCPLRLWNGGVNWCVGSGSPCIGCCEPGFPDIFSPLYEKIVDVPIPKIGEVWAKKQEEGSE